MNVGLSVQVLVIPELFESRQKGPSRVREHGPVGENKTRRVNEFRAPHTGAVSVRLHAKIPEELMLKRLTIECHRGSSPSMAPSQVEGLDCHVLRRTRFLLPAVKAGPSCAAPSFSAICCAHLLEVQVYFAFLRKSSSLRLKEHAKTARFY